MKVYHFLLLLLPFMTLIGCNDDSPDSPLNEIEEVDDFLGDARTFQLGTETSGLTSTEITCKIMTPDGEIISRRGTHSRVNGVSNFVLGNGLKDGTYRLLYAEYPIGDNQELAHLSDRFETAQYGLGCRITVSGGSIVVCDSFDSDINLVGSGTSDDPYIISSYSHLITLMKYVNSDETNKKITSSTYFRQTNPIDMEQASFECDVRYGWYPIGADTNTPFRGIYKGDEISYLWINRPNTAGVGLFGYVYNASIDSLKMSHADITGNFAVGSAVGATISGGGQKGRAAFTNCSVSKSTVVGSPQSFSVGGLVGAADMYTQTLIQKCMSDGNSISGSYNVGGLIGGSGRFSNLMVAECSNTSSIIGEYSGVGGLIGVADTLYVIGCTNAAIIKGATAYSAGDGDNSGIGAGGICGGSGVSWLTSCANSGNVSGSYGVGGIIGSTRIKGGGGEAYMYNNTLLRWCSNSGNVSGTSCVGGMCGESQFGSYGVINRGNVTGGDYTAGIAGITSIAVAHNAVNTGIITGGSYCSGIIGKTTWGSIALDHNYGTVSGKGSHTAGILGLGGNNTIVHYCGNFGSVAGSGSGPVGGIIGEIGDPREWTAMNIAECVIGSAEIVMSFLGPVIAVAGHAVAKGVEVALHLTELAVEFALIGADTYMEVTAIIELVDPEVAEELKNSLKVASEDMGTNIKDEMAAVRNTYSGFDVGVFDKSCITSGYSGNVASTLDYYEADGNDEIFNENINKRREERMEELEKVSEVKEIVHTVIAGVSVVASTVAFVGGIVASGGLAVPFVVLGSAAAMVGGINAIMKTATEFAENAVVVSQCVNSGKVTGSGEHVAGIAGVIQDNSLVTDCLNTADLESPLVDECKSHSEVYNCIAFGSKNIPEACDDIICYDKDGLYKDCKGEMYLNYGLMFFDAEDFGKESSYHQSGVSKAESSGVTVEWTFDWDLGADKKWNLGTGSGYVYAVPNYSEMRD